MLFHTIEFVIFFLIVMFLRFLLPKKFEKAIIALASFVFYAWWSLKLSLLFALAIVVSFLSAKYIARSDNKNYRRMFLLFGIFINFGILIFFKYWMWLGGLFNVNFSYNILLPLGISFYTFQAMSYTFDVYMKKLKHEEDFISFVAYVSFFPQLVAGPIERSEDLMTQINRGPLLINRYLASGLSIFAWGLIKKVIFADHFAPYVQEVYSGYDYVSGLELLLATYAFALQIYCDFSGYTDMARGIARIMGYELHHNFYFPYFAQNIREFWQRWHITLSTWFRDYVYIPLGGNRVPKLRSYLNIFVTMLIAGLWHGANLTFVAWGAFHGLMISVYHFVDDKIPKDSILRTQNFFAKLIKIVFTFHVVMIGWIFFRAGSLNQALVIIRKIFEFDFSLMGYEYSFTLMLILVAALLIERYTKLCSTISKNYFFNWILIWLGLFAVVVFGAVTKTDFIYFQF